MRTLHLEVELLKGRVERLHPGRPHAALDELDDDVCNPVRLIVYDRLGPVVPYIEPAVVF
jgi:hypothetical protein